MLPAASQKIRGRSPLEEFHRVLQGIGSPVLALREKTENERAASSTFAQIV